MNKVNKLNLKPIINKDNFYKKLHIIENTETYKSADFIYDELVEFLQNKININALYVIVESWDIANIEYEKFMLCFISIENEINDVVNEIMSNGEYLKGYLLNEMSIYALFNASNEMNEIIKNEAFKEGFILSKRYAAGDGEIKLEEQNKILEELKKHIFINAFVNREHVIIPEKSLLYFYGLKKKELLKEDFNYDCNECNNCTKLNCQYREIE